MKNPEPPRTLPLKRLRREDYPLADVMDLYDVLRGSLWFLILFPLLAAAAALLVAFVILPPTYHSDAVIIPLEAESGPDSLLTDFLDPLPLTLEISRNDESRGIMAFLNSRLLKKRLIEKHALLPVLYPRLWDEETSQWEVPKDEIPTVTSALQDEALDDVFKIENDEDAGLIELVWSCRDPALCARMLENALSELETYLERDYVSDAVRNRVFLEGQVAEAAAEVRLWESKVPGPNLSAPAIARELEAARTVYVELRRRLAVAEIAEAERRPDFKILDPPFVPELWDKLPRIVAVVLVYVAAMALALALIFARRFILEARAEHKIRTEA